MSSADEIVTELEEKIFAMRYRKDSCGADYLEGLLKQIKDLDELHSECKTGEDVQDGERAGFQQAKGRIIKAVLENKHLKTRGEMIAAARGLEVE